MSQTMRIPKINDSFYGEILTYFPDEEEIAGISPVRQRGGQSM